MSIDAQLDAYFARDLERFVACYAPDVVITNAAGEVLAEGHDAVRQMYGGLFENSPQLAGRIANRLVVGNFVADHEEIEGFDFTRYAELDSGNRRLPDDRREDQPGGALLLNVGGQSPPLSTQRSPSANPCGWAARNP